MVNSIRALASISLIILTITAVACARAENHFSASEPRKDSAVADTPAPSDRVTVVGERITVGDAVECPQLRADDGTTYSISYLSPSIAVGSRVSVTGSFVHVTHCRGRVLHAETVQVLN